MALSALALMARPAVLAPVVIALLVSATALQSARLSHAKADLAKARAAAIDPASRRSWREEAEERSAALRACSQSRAELEASLQRQNAAVQTWAAEAARATSRATALAHAARASVATARGRASHILEAKRGEDACLSADTLILDSLAPETRP